MGLMRRFRQLYPFERFGLIGIAINAAVHGTMAALGQSYDWSYYIVWIAFLIAGAGQRWQRRRTGARGGMGAWGLGGLGESARNHRRPG